VACIGILAGDAITAIPIAAGDYFNFYYLAEQ
jgi:hypothetical protein